MHKRVGKQTVKFDVPPSIIEAAGVVGKKEGEGPLGALFDRAEKDDFFGEKTWEKAESRMVGDAFTRAVAKSRLTVDNIAYVLGGDLLNQLISTSFGIRDSSRPYLGLFGACSTMAEALLLGAMLVDGGFAGYIAATASSHFCSAERQFRVPLEYGGQRTPTAQWTVTGAGAVVLGADGPGPYITHATAGIIVDQGITDTNNMGAAMAPAAYDTIGAYLRDTQSSPSELDLIVTGDLGSHGRDITADLFMRDGIKIDNLVDCGVMIYDMKTQDVKSGGSGCGCSAVTLCCHFLKEMREGRLNSILFCGTGALMSPVSSGQGESIPSVCHALRIQNSR